LALKFLGLCFWKLKMIYVTKLNVDFTLIKIVVTMKEYSLRIFFTVH